MIDESKCNCSIEPVDVALTRINGTIFTTAQLNSAFSQTDTTRRRIYEKNSFYNWKRTILF